MQVAMRLGPYWWKRLGEKTVYDSTVRKCTLWGISLMAFVAIEWLGLATLVGGVEKYRSSAEIVKTLYQIIFISAAVSGLIGIIFLAGISVIFIRSLIATLRFRTIFGFSPPVTDEGRKAVQLAVDRVLSFLAIARAKEYSHEKELVESIRANGRAISECENTENFLGGPIQNIGTLITQLERKLCELEKSKKTAEKNYYKTRNTAQNPFLPIPFLVQDSFKKYLPKKGG